ncbi:MAG: hypothetical protein AAF939_16350 [Planctomycetota bacterium]
MSSLEWAANGTGDDQNYVTPMSLVTILEDLREVPLSMAWKLVNGTLGA